MTEEDRLIKRLQNLVKRMQPILDDIVVKRELTQIENQVTDLIEKRNAELLFNAISKPEHTIAAA